MLKDIKAKTDMLENDSVLVLNLISDLNIAENTYETMKMQYSFDILDCYNIPIKKSNPLENTLHTDLKYLNIRFVYLVDNIDDIDLKDRWIKYRISKHDLIISKDLDMYICH